MLEALTSALLSYATLIFWLYLIAGVCIGLFFGLVPGLSGMTALAVLLPLIYGMPPALGLAFLLAAHAIVYTGGSVTAVLLSIPGAPANAATLIDGFPMTQQGKASQAVGAAVTASAVGGVIGAIALFILSWLIADIVLVFGAPEIFVVVLLGILFISVLGRGSMVKGLISGGLGMMFAFVGYHLVTGAPRATFGWTYLYDGFPLIPLALGLFAVPEMIALARGGTIAQPTATFKTSISDVLEGGKEIFRHWWLTLRSAAIGIGVGIVPGAGGETAPFVAYGSAKESSKNRDQFGKGCIEGVIAPESANNAKEGGALLPTLALGIPGSAGMAILLGGFWIVGLEPGPLFLQEHLEVAYTMILALVLGNLLGSGMVILFSRFLTKIPLIRGNFIVPLILAFSCIGSFIPKSDLWDVLIILPLAALGYALRELGYNRPAFMLGFVLANLAEKYFFITLDSYGWQGFFLRPISLTMIIFLIIYFNYGRIKTFFSRIFPGRRKG
ncbi:MAG: tripartite tricarboxylate transporter permease [Deltaproteobacteria bacterium]|nr:MAG: tripartite tricarboxylate transporter permease [Deltaproteobacteria bacterium]